MKHLNPYAGPNTALAQFQPDACLLEPASWRIAAALLGDWLLIAMAFAGAILLPHPVVYVLAAVLIARSQLALAVMMHEAAHGLLARSKPLNDALGQLLTAAPLWLSLSTYRAGHIKHHHAPMASDDPVALMFAVHDYPVSRGRLIARLLAYGCGAGYVMSIARLARGELAHALPKVVKSRRYQAWELASMLITNGLLLGLLAYAGHGWLYLGLWLVPSITLLPLAGQVRAIFEHAGLCASTDQSSNARTIARRSWQTFLFGPHSIHYHIEHHLFPRMPFYHLNTVHGQLAARGILPKANIYPDYGTVLRDVVHDVNTSQ
jgi:fatty acid desaturase